MATSVRSKGARSASPLRSSAPDNLRRSGSFGKSSGKNQHLAASFDSKSRNHVRSSSSTAEIGNIENEYIRNLQQQIYFLELEANYLYPYDKSHAAEKRQLVNEIVSLKKMSDLRERESARRDVQVHQYKSEADKGLTALQEAERKVQHYRIELDHKTEDLNNLRIELEEKRAECLKLKTQLQEMDDKFFDSQAKTKEELGSALREEIRQLRLQLKEKEINAEQDRSLRNKDRAHKDEKDFRRHANIQELVALKESEKHLQHELERVKELLRIEQQNHRETLAKLSREEQASLEANVKRTQLRNELNEVEGHQDSTNSENVALKRDKLLLADEVANLNAKLDERDEEVERLKVRLEDSESRCSHMESKVRMQRSLESIKWEEFEKLATTMREFSRSMSPSKSGSLVDH
ncbi:hypothetical protein AWC38_SpisGene20639 [Stylophora pistillata]|uniref:Uncharacterized protein n=1 Tax=Stylophora pistillata TaxID=50429 RepID=A0A2B4RDC1_STYPI|nr:hypothetical protein AWC38_SpisGene20639 [Stylophora pistillata]